MQIVYSWLLKWVAASIKDNFTMDELNIYLCLLQLMMYL